MKDKLLVQYLDEVASTDPTRGGGSVSAISGAMGVSLMLMVARLMASKEKFASEHLALNAMINSLETVKESLVDFADQDSKAFESVMEAYRLPKLTEHEKQQRSKAIEQALIKASLIPLHVMQRVSDVAVMMEELLTMCPASFKSDALVGTLMLNSAFEGAQMNVKINLDSLANSDEKQQIKQKMDEMSHQWHYFIQRYQQH